MTLHWIASIARSERLKNPMPYNWLDLPFRALEANLCYSALPSYTDCFGLIILLLEERYSQSSTWRDGTGEWRFGTHITGQIHTGYHIDLGWALDNSLTTPAFHMRILPPLSVDSWASFCKQVWIGGARIYPDKPEQSKSLHRAFN